MRYRQNKGDGCLSEHTRSRSSVYHCCRIDLFDLFKCTDTVSTIIK